MGTRLDGAFGVFLAVAIAGCASTPEPAASRSTNPAPYAWSGRARVIGQTANERGYAAPDANGYFLLTRFDGDTPNFVSVAREVRGLRAKSNEALYFPAPGAPFEVVLVGKSSGGAVYSDGDKNLSEVCDRTKRAASLLTVCTSGYSSINIDGADVVSAALTFGLTLAAGAGESVFKRDDLETVVSDAATRSPVTQPGALASALAQMRAARDTQVAAQQQTQRTEQARKQTNDQARDRCWAQFPQAKARLAEEFRAEAQRWASQCSQRGYTSLPLTTGAKLRLASWRGLPISYGPGWDQCEGELRWQAERQQQRTEADYLLAGGPMSVAGTPLTFQEVAGELCR